MIIYYNYKLPRRIIKRSFETEHIYYRKYIHSKKQFGYNAVSRHVYCVVYYSIYHSIFYESVSTVEADPRILSMSF